MQQNNKTLKWIEKVKLTHNNKFDYSKTNYVNSGEKVIIICPEHGEFEQIASNHSRGKDCKKCSIKFVNKLNSKSLKQFIIDANKKHNNKYDYSKVIYNISREKVIIICPEHGEFEQQANAHLKGQNCPKCSKNSQKILFKKSIEQFIIDANKKHNNKYNYSKIEYDNMYNKIIIICPEHGEFEQLAKNHQQGKGCPKCVNKISKSEQEIYDFIKSLGIDNIQQSNRTILNNKELDIYLPDYNLGIEFNGLYWHNEDYKEDNYHQKKTDECLSKNIQLIQIFEDEWLYKKDIVKSRLLNILHKIESNKIIYARKCFIKEIDSTFARKFTERNHLQGFVGAKIHLGLFYIIDNKEYLVSYMSFGNLRKNLGQKEITYNHYELLRFCNVINYRVIGGASKLLKYFEKNYKPEKIISYADRRWSNGNLYNQLGFILTHISKPNYYYVDYLTRHNRFGYRKDILISKYDCKPEMTERDFCRNILGLKRIYDAGNMVYEHKEKMN